MIDDDLHTKEDFEKYIKSLCIFKDISVSELARRFGTSPQNFSSRLKACGFNYLELQQIADILGYDIKWVKRK